MGRRVDSLILGCLGVREDDSFAVICVPEVESLAADNTAIRLPLLPANRGHEGIANVLQRIAFRHHIFLPEGFKEWQAAKADTRQPPPPAHAPNEGVPFWRDAPGKQPRPHSDA